MWRLSSAALFVPASGVDGRQEDEQGDMPPVVALIDRLTRELCVGGQRLLAIIAPAGIDSDRASKFRLTSV